MYIKLTTGAYHGGAFLVLQHSGMLDFESLSSLKHVLPTANQSMIQLSCCLLSAGNASIDQTMTFLLFRSDTPTEQTGIRREKDDVMPTWIVKR